MPECSQGVQFQNDNEFVPLDKFRTMPFSRCKYNTQSGITYLKSNKSVDSCRFVFCCCLLRYMMFSETDLRSSTSSEVGEYGVRAFAPFLRTTEWRTLSAICTLFPLSNEERNKLEEFLLRELTPVSSEDYEPIVPHLAWSRALLNMKKNMERDGDESWLKIAAASMCLG